MSDVFASNGLFDPWIGDPQEWQRTKALCQIIVNGMDVTNNLDPHLISVRIIQGQGCRAEIELDDRDGKLDIPPPQSTVVVNLGWASEGMVVTFNGPIFQLEAGVDRQQGRRMWIHCNGGQWSTSQLKEPMQNSWGSGAKAGQAQGSPVNFQQVVQSVVGKIGGSANISSAFSSSQRDFWHQSNESPVHFLQRLTNELGGVMQLTGNNNFNIAKPGEGMTTTIAKLGKNLIGCRVTPFAARSAWAGARQEFFDTIQSQFKKISQGFGGIGPWASAIAQFQLPVSAGNSNTAQQQASGGGGNQYVGRGRVVIDGEPAATWNGHCIIQGVRTGVDGSYFINQVEHIYSRQGFITWLDVTPDVSSNTVANGLENNPTPDAATTPAPATFDDRFDAVNGNTTFDDRFNAARGNAAGATFQDRFGAINPGNQ